MAMRSIMLGAVGLFLLACSNSPRESTGEAAEAGVAKTEARAIVDGARARFRPSLVGAPIVGAAGQRLVPTADAIVSAGQGALASIAYPPKANGHVRITDAASGVEARYALSGAAAHDAEIADDLVVYRDALGSGVPVMHRPTLAGNEDFVVFERAPATARVSYSLDLGEKIAGLRLVANTLEMVDEKGMPRLRVAPPWLVGHDGRVVDARLSVEGCAVDGDASFPWDHAPVGPGARTCTVHVSWDRDAVAYPALLDPAWQSTGTMATNRNEAAVTACGTPSSGTASTHLVLAAGGNNATSGAALSSAEVYNATSGTWSTAGSMPSARAAAASIYDPTVNRIWVIGGRNGATASGATDLWSCGANSWTAGGNVGARYGHAVTMQVGNGFVWVVGGRTGASTMTNSIARAQTGSSSPFWITITGAARAEATAYAANGFSDTGGAGYEQCVVWMGGRNAAGTVLNTSGIYCMGSGGNYGPSESTGTLSAPRANHRMVPSGAQFLLTGGTNGTSDLSTVEVFNPGSFLAFGKAGFSAGTAMPVARNGHVAIAMDANHALVAGGAGTAATTSHLFDATTGAWTAAGPLVGSHVNGIGGAKLPGVSALVVGGPSNPERWTQRANGIACTEAGECTSGFCVDGFCCNTACAGTCQACSNALTGGANGTCANTKSGGDSKGKCGATSASSCGEDGTCNGAGACRKWPSGTVCQAQSCASSTVQNNQRTCNGSGTCQALTTTTCATAYVCTSLGSVDGCATSCTGTDDSKCAAGFHCNGSTCVAGFAKAATCTRDRECESGFCTDGVCCGARCGGPCEACTAAMKESGADGDCGVVPAGKDPRNRCAADGGYPSSCKADGFCDGSGACRAFALKDTVCGTPTCTAGKATTSLCDGSGVCNLTETSCAPSSCNTTGTACAGDCALDSDCSSTGYCDAATKKCVTKKANGEPATEGRVCQSGIAADGVCCNDTCDGPCEACDGSATAGTCTAVTGKAKHGTCPAATADACSASSCDGTERKSCLAKAGADVVCQPPSCSNGVETIETRCDGSGACPAPATKNCTPYACDTAACKTKCATNGDCAAGFFCDPTSGVCGAGASCVDDKTLQRSDGTTETCVAFKCSGQQCLKSCTNTADCQSGFVCNSSTTQCEPAPSGDTGDDGGCAIGTHGRGASSFDLLGMGVALALLARRKRPRTL